MQGWLEVCGGVGLFLSGMALMTEGLRIVAGDAVRRGLARFAKGPLSGAITGAFATGLVQSSSVVTVMAVGFVGAGIMTFKQSLGSFSEPTSARRRPDGWWLCSDQAESGTHRFAGPVRRGIAPSVRTGEDKGFRANAGRFRHVVFLASRFCSRGWRSTPICIARKLPGEYPRRKDSIVDDRLADHLGYAVFERRYRDRGDGSSRWIRVAAAGGRLGRRDGCRDNGHRHAGDGRRQRECSADRAFSCRLQLHDGHLRLSFRAALRSSMGSLGRSFFGEGSELGLVVFHTLFNVIGVLCVLPITNRFADFIVWLVPTGKCDLERRLEPSLLTDPRLALEGIHATLDEIVKIVFSELATLLRSRESPSVFVNAMQQAEQATLKTSKYLESVRPRDSDALSDGRQRTAYHVLDHLRRLLVRAAKEDRLRAVLHDPTLNQWSENLSAAVDAAARNGFTLEAAKALETVWVDLDRIAEPYRQGIIEQSILEGKTSKTTLDSLDGIRWLRRLAYHAWRIVFHLAQAGTGVAAKPDAPILREESDPIDE